MLDELLFEYADVICADDDAPGGRYVMAKEERSWQEALLYIENNKCRIDKLVLKPKTNQMRFMFLPSRANNNKTEVFNVMSPPVNFLRKLWETNASGLQNAMTKFIIQSYKDKYDGLDAADKTWVTAAVLGSKED